MPMDNLIQKPWSLNRDLTIKNQILIISFLFSILIVGFLFGAALTSQEFLQKALKDASYNIFQSETRNFQNFAWIYQHGMEELVCITSHHISTVRKLNKFVQEQEKKGQQIMIPKPKMCLTNKKDLDQFCFLNSMSCGVFGTPLNAELTQQLKNIMITTSLMDVLRLEYDFYSQSPILYSFNNSAQYYCLAVGLPFPSSFQPLKRPYYLETLEKMKNTTNPEQFYFTNPYLTVAGKIRCPLTTALLDLKNQFIGLIAKDLDFNYTQINKQNIQKITTYVLGLDGKVVFTDKYRVLDQPVFYLNESQYSGFNQQDFEQIMLQHYGKQFQSNCNHFYNILCRFNTILSDNIIIKTVNITNTPYILVILQKTNELKSLETEHVEFLNRQIDFIISALILTTLICALVIIIFSQIITIFILRQLNNMINKINKLIHKTHSKPNKKKSIQELMKDPFWMERNELNEIEELFQQNSIRSDCVTNLTQTIVNLFHHMISQKKSEECLIQEKLIQYPTLERVQFRNLKGIKQIIKFLKDRPSLAKKISTVSIKYKSLNENQILNS